MGKNRVKLLGEKKNKIQKQKNKRNARPNDNRQPRRPRFFYY